MSKEVKIVNILIEENEIGGIEEEVIDTEFYTFRNYNHFKKYVKSRENIGCYIVEANYNRGILRYWS